MSLIKKLPFKEILGVLFLLIAIYFFWNERKELASLQTFLKNTNIYWLVAGIAFTVVYVLLQAALYVYSFPAVGGKISWLNAVELFLKRNVISVFVPAGGITALAYLPESLKKNHLRHIVHQASLIYGFIGIFSVFIVAVPVLLYLSVTKSTIPGTTAGLFTIIAMLAAMILLARSIQKKGKLYLWVIKGRPKLGQTLQEVFSFKIVWKQFINATIASVFLEIVGIIHLYIAMLATGVTPSFQGSVTGYIVATIFLIISPFLRGMGAIEVSLTIILNKYGFTTAHALIITLLFRFFEFWLPLFAGLLSYAAKGLHLFRRPQPEY